MSYFCGNCGERIKECSRFCGRCGTPVVEAGSPTQEMDSTVSNVTTRVIPAENRIMNRTETVVQSAKHYDGSGMVTTAKRGSRKWLVPVIVSVMALTVIALALILFFHQGGDPCETALNNLVQALNKPSVKNVEKLAPEEFWDDLEDRDPDHGLHAYAKSLERLIEIHKIRNLDPSEMHFEILEEKELSSKKLEELAEALEDAHYIDAEDVTAAWRIVIERTVEDSDDDTKEFEMYVVEIDSSWYMVHYDGDSRAMFYIYRCMVTANLTIIR